jgi:hypothetical protein
LWTFYKNAITISFKGEITMAISKQIQAGPALVNISEAAGIVTLQASLAQSVGGGQAAGALKASASVEIDIEVKQLIDLGLELAQAKFPAAAALIAAAQSAIDAELAKA